MSNTENIPVHIAIIMDGNGRWAEMRGLPRLEGHARGVESVRKAIKECRRRGISYLTLFVFSTENWGRPQEEVDGLMELLCKSIAAEMDELKRNSVKVRIIGDRETMSEKVQAYLSMIEEGTSECGELNLILALNYGSREEIMVAAKKLAEKVVAGEIRPQEITPQMFNDSLYTAGVPDPDLLIRTSGEYRLSNFLLWQSAYTEFYFTGTLWPDFDEQELGKAIEAYSERDRRYGGLKICASMEAES